MTTSTPPLAPASGTIRSVVARHPVAGMLIMMFVISWAILMPPAVAGLPLEPFLLFAVLLGQLLPAVLVTAAVGGRPAVRELFGRVFRWRVNLVWYVVALLAIPVLALLITTVFYGTGALHALVTDPSVILAYAFSLSIFPLVNLWEETAWMGVVQAQLAISRGPLLAAVLTGPLFGLLHLPLRIDQPLGRLVPGLLGAMALAIALRVLIGWLYNVTGGSIFVAALVHLTFNATNNGTLLTAAAPGNVMVQNIPWVTIGILGLGVIVLTRGRLGAPDDDGQRRQARVPAQSRPA
jgi:membrane protease YdiL (CAAX protease family)